MSDETPVPDGHCFIEDPSYPGLYLAHTPNALTEDPDYPDFYLIGNN